MFMCVFLLASRCFACQLQIYVIKEEPYYAYVYRMHIPFVCVWVCVCVCVYVCACHALTGEGVVMSDLCLLSVWGCECVCVCVFCLFFPRIPLSLSELLPS